MQALHARCNDVACQTDAGQTALLHLVQQYPANLIYAQGMVNTSILQLQQVELHIALLHAYLSEHRSAELAATVLSSTTWMPKEKVHGEAAGVPVAQPAAGAADGAQPVPAPAPAAAEQEAEQQRNHRRRLAAAVKVALVMILLEVKMGWFFVYFFLVFLYIGGMFDPLIDWFQSYNTQATLENQLTALRRRQQEPSNARSEAEAGAGADPPADGSEEQVQGDTPARTADEAPAEVQPPFWQRSIYQLVVMFFLTLIPWWTPNPRYL